MWTTYGGLVSVSAVVVGALQLMQVLAYGRSARDGLLAFLLLWVLMAVCLCAVLAARRRWSRREG